MIRFEQLRGRDVIHIGDGVRIGGVEDLRLEPESGRTVSLVVLGNFSLRRFFRRQREYEIPWQAVRRVGRDAVLVDWSVPVDVTSPLEFIRNFLERK